MSAPKEEVWMILVIFKNAQTLVICASEHVCKTAYDKWTDAKTQDFDNDVLIEVSGITDSADRAPCNVAFMHTEVMAIRTWRMY